MSSYIQRFEKCDEFLNKKGIFRFLFPTYMGDFYFENGSVTRALRFIAEDAEYQIHKITLIKHQVPYDVFVICHPEDRVFIYAQLQHMFDNSYRTVEPVYFQENLLNESKLTFQKTDAWLDIQDGGYFNSNQEVCFKNNPFFFTTDEALCYKVMLTLKNSLQTDEVEITFKPGEKVHFIFKDNKVAEGKVVALFHDKVSYVIKAHGKSYLKHKHEIVREKEKIGKYLKAY